MTRRGKQYRELPPTPPLQGIRRQTLPAHIQAEHHLEDLEWTIDGLSGTPMTVQQLDRLAWNLARAQHLALVRVRELRSHPGIRVYRTRSEKESA